MQTTDGAASWDEKIERVLELMQYIWSRTTKPVLPSLPPPSGEVKHVAFKLLRAAFGDAAQKNDFAELYPCHAGALPEVHPAG